MSILDKKSTTVEQSIRNLSGKMYNRLKAEHSTIFRMIWNNSEGFSAQEILDDFGTDAAELFNLSSQMQIMLAQIDSSYVPLLPPNEFTIQEDGTVIISYDNPSA